MPVSLRVRSGRRNIAFDAQAEVSVRLEEDGKSVTAKAADPDTLVASAKAYVSGINKLMTRRGKGKPEALKAAVGLTP